MPIWFWSWMLVTAVLAVTSFFDRDYYVMPWAIGSAVATILVGLVGPTGWEWAGFLLLSAALTVVVQRFRAPGRKSLRKRRKAA